MSKPPSVDESRVEQIIEAPNSHLTSGCEVGLVITTYNRPRYLANLDSDTLVRPRWLSEILRLYRE
jgi:hypothetical protein